MNRIFTALLGAALLASPALLAADSKSDSDAEEAPSKSAQIECTLYDGDDIVAFKEAYYVLCDDGHYLGPYTTQSAAVAAGRSGCAYGDFDLVQVCD